MPELPEVECWGRRVAERACVGRTIEKVVVDPAETIVIEGVTPRTLARKLRGRRVEASHRRGKQMWWTLDRGPHPLWHFGMTGGFHHYPPEAERPRFVKVELHLDDGMCFAFADARRFGRVRMLDDPEREKPLSQLGPDALHELPSAAWLIERFAQRKTPIKALLLNQSFLAGVGNWIADEVLYQSGIAPQRLAHALTPAEIKRLRAKLRYVLSKACDWEADYRRFPKTWLFHHRWGKNNGALTGRGEEIAYDTVGGRTTAWVPTAQR
ncbi:MAG: hypothetical protein GVY24_01350 [Planctomycetes bacterium]|jgi:formamidopyrimidine-DNA glycosylase|nr:hypothetical protein [Planctomycetota bacterium]